MRFLGSRLAVIPFLAIALIVSPVRAQSGAGTTAYPQTIVCVQLENYGVVTDESLDHPHNIVMNFASASDGEYAYSGLATNWKDGGGGQSVTVSYDASTGKFKSATNGITCPLSIVQ